MSEHFNALTPAEAERLACLAEECGEVVQIVGKILRHGYDSKYPAGGPTNRRLLEKEIGDVWATVDLIVAAEDVSDSHIEKVRASKFISRRPYLHHQEDA